MEPTPREEAGELARLRVEEDATPIIRRIEASLMLWQGRGAVYIALAKDTQESLTEYVAEQYRSVGWDVTVTTTSYETSFKMK